MSIPTNSSIPTISSLAFLTPGNFADDDPYTGLEETLQLFEYGERLGFDGAWIRQRHLEHGVGSAAVFLAAAGQRTERVELGTAVIAIGYESPFRLAEDLALADVLSRGRLQVGFSTGMPHAELLGDLVYDGDWRSFDLSYGRVARVIDNLRGDYLGEPDTLIQFAGQHPAAAAATAQPRPGGPHLVRGKPPALDPVGRRARPQPAERQHRHR
ncbi:LLM class flavin-dependent oxidoreductase [Streptomyces sp. NBC_01615]|uniref:LLM class flavin-dependent oxidoreductase n=1 Tax=Streptomyces sp. NBC_01615 TaxID=2975898 RepID=UPI00386C008C